MLTSPGWAGQQHHSRISGTDFGDESHQLLDYARSSEKPGLISSPESGQSLIRTLAVGDVG